MKLIMLRLLMAFMYRCLIKDADAMWDGMAQCIRKSAKEVL